MRLGSFFRIFRMHLLVVSLQLSGGVEAHTFSSAVCLPVCVCVCVCVLRRHFCPDRSCANAEGVASVLLRHRAASCFEEKPNSYTIFLPTLALEPLCC